MHRCLHSQSKGIIFHGDLLISEIFGGYPNPWRTSKVKLGGKMRTTKLH